jgi:hypothetical protein
VQRSNFVATRLASIRLGRGGKRLIGYQCHHGIYRRVNALDLIEMRLHQFER